MLAFRDFSIILVFVHQCLTFFSPLFLVGDRYTVAEENALAVVNNQDTTFKLQEEIAKASEELSRIYGSLVGAYILLSLTLFT